MADSTDEPSGRESSASSEGTDAGRGEAGGEQTSGSGLGRREFLIGGGAAGVIALGGVGAYLSMSSDTEVEEASFILQQGYLRYQVNPISKDEMNVEQFYDYTDTSASPEGDIIEEDAVSRMFIYDGPVDSSLVFLHGSADVGHGGTATFAFSGLSRDQGEWAVRDDPMSVSDDFEKWEGGNQKVKWEWGENTSDGGAYWGVLDRTDFTISVNPKTLRGVDAWTFISGDLGNLTRHDLYQEKPVKIKPPKGKTVKKANIDIMPDSEEAEFDPYSNDLLTVAVKDPPAGVDESEWVGPDDLDPGNYAVNFGSKQYLAGQNAAQPQTYTKQGGTLYLKYKAKAANFSLDSAYGYLVSKAGEKTYVRGRDVVQPGGFYNVDEEPAQLVVSDLHVDPEDDDRKNLAEEYVEFTNDGDEKLDLSNYTIRDTAGAEFAVPDGFVLAAGQSFRLHSGAGESTETDLYWDAGKPVWNNDGDTVIVLDENANEVLAYSYPRE
ncbi:lamin tail domain-containing protein [Halorarius halobius]|uniref:lamin tail domain-containing protein n=1 Tax=Halorarius halobius TaxID=2962671 RepID=UPI0020CBB2E7|nr:lamin tail domain-containing protein [Halorarius halobius]